MILSQRHRELVLFKALANLRSEASRTYLSFIWWIIDPILYMTAFYIVFGLGLRSGTKDFIPFLLVGLVPWKWFGETVNHGMSSILGGKQLMEQVHLPKVVFPIISILTDTFKFLTAFSVIILFLWIYGLRFNLAILALPIVLGTQLLLITATTYFLAALTPFLPDLQFLVRAVLQLLMFVSGVFYDVATMPKKIQIFMKMNPMTILLIDYRRVLMHRQWPYWSSLFIIAIISFIGVIVNQLLIRKYDHVYPRVIM